MTTNDSGNSGPPPRVSGKDTSNLQPDAGRSLTHNKVEMMTDTIGRRSGTNADAINREAIMKENAFRARRNKWKAAARVDSGYLEDVSDDEELLDVPPLYPTFMRTMHPAELTEEEKILKVASALRGLTPTTKGLMSDLVKKGLTAVIPAAVSALPVDDASEAPVFTVENTIRSSVTTSAYEIPRPLINLAWSKVHILLTLLTTASIRRIHTDPSCIKMKKGLVMEDPKRSIMDTSSGFPAESTLLPGQFNEAYKNFLKLLAKVADKQIVQEFWDHCDFLTERDDFNDNFDMILSFDIEIRRKYFNTLTLMDEAAYTQHWNEVRIDTKLACQEQAATAAASVSNNRYQPYPPCKTTPLQRHRTPPPMESPFGGAKEKTRCSTPSFASFAVGMGTSRTTAPTPKPSKVPRLYAPGTMEKSSSSPTTQSFAFPSTSEGVQHQDTTPTSCTSAPSADRSPTTQHQNPAEVYRRVITPYDADAFELALSKLNLLDRYPDLPYNILNGFPIGDILPLRKTYTPKNHKTARDRPDVILEYCLDEVKVGHMSRPYTKEEVHTILGGHFATSPLGLVEKAGDPGKFRIVRDFSFENEDGFAVNNFLVKVVLSD